MIDEKDVLEVCDSLEGEMVEEVPGEAVKEILRKVAEILGFASCLFKNDGSVVVHVTANIPSGLEGFEDPAIKILAACKLIGEVTRAVARRKTIADEARYQRILDSARGMKSSATKLHYLWSPEGLEELPGEELELFTKASVKA